MQCTSCGADNADTAAYCQLCLEHFDGRAEPRVRRAAAAAAPGGELVAEHEWWVRRRAENAGAFELGLPTKGSTYALAAFDGQVRHWRALWWSASVFAAFAWLAAMRLTAFDWVAAGGFGRASSPSTILQAALILCVGAAAACVCAAWVGGPEAWRATLVNVPFWSPLAALLAVVAVVGAEYGLWLVSVLFVGTVLITAIVPLGRPLSRAVPRA